MPINHIYIYKGVIGLDLPLGSPSNMILTLTQEATLCLQWYLPSFVSALLTCIALVMPNLSLLSLTLFKGWIVSNIFYEGHFSVANRDACL